MNLNKPNSQGIARPHGPMKGAVLAEYMVAVAIFSLGTIALVYTQMFGMRQDQLVNTKSGACEMARMSFNDLNNDIRAAKIWDIGNGNLASFTALGQGIAQRGNAIRLSFTTDAEQYVMYYFNTNTCRLMRYRSGDSRAKVIAQNLTNSMFFAAEDSRGNIQTNLTHKGVIHVTMQIAQYQYPLTRIGPGYYYDFYELNFHATPHVPDGP